MNFPSPPPEPLVEFIANRFKVLSEPMRIRILDRLRSGERSVGDLVAELGTTQQNVSRHLATMHQDGMLGRRREGSRVIYWIDDPDVLALCDHVCNGYARRAEEMQRVLAGGAQPA